MRRHALLVTAVTLSLTHATPARAVDHVDFEAAARVGAATSPGWIANPYAFGFGARAGVSVYGFYGGISGLYYLGGSAGSSGFHTVLVGLEGGYTIKLPFVRIRPQVGVGDGTFSQSASDGASNPAQTTSVGNVYVEPGVVVLVPVGPIFVGADANAILLPGFTLATAEGAPPAVARTYASFSAHAQIGVFF
jgi:hypothetical protein